MKKSLSATVFAIFLVCVNGAKILFLTPFATRSEMNMFNPIVEELALRNHEVVVFSPFDFKSTHKNIRREVVDNEFFEKDNMITEYLDQVKYHPIWSSAAFKPIFEDSCQGYFKNVKIQQQLKQGVQFDVAIVSIVFNECALATAHLMAKHLIGISSFPSSSWDSSFFVPRPPSYVPNYNLPYTEKMNFFQRVNNVITTVAMQLVVDYYILPDLQEIIRANMPENPSIYEGRKRPDLFLINAEFVLTTPRPTMPNLINVGGLHCRKTEPLPKDLEEFINSSGKEGVILFSLGTVVKGKFLSSEKKNAFLKVFSKLKQKVIWKYEEELPNVPPNVLLTKWMPQQDILGHPKLRLFITHGGLLSLQETVYHGKPVVAIPVFGDQIANVARVEELGIGKKLDYFNISSDSVSEVINSVLNDKSYVENVKIYSDIFRDHYHTPLKTAIFWTEYVIRNDGAQFLRSPGEHLNFFQYFLLDIIGFFLLILIMVVTFVITVMKCIFKYFSCQNKSKKKKKD